MLSISSSINTTLSALNAQQAAIDITSNNIANVNTDGYSRQQVVIKDSAMTTTTRSKRIYDAFLTKQLSTANRQLGEYDAKAKYLDSVEVIFNESDGSGLSSAMSTFWSAWQSLANNPSGASERSVLVSDAKALATTFNNISSDLTDVRSNIDSDVVDTVNTINQDTQQIASLNQKIAQAKAAGQDASTCQDSLDTLVSDLSTLVNIKTYQNDAGQTCIQLADGKPLVDGATSRALSTATNTTTGLRDVTWIDGSGNAAVITSVITSGKLGGCLEVRDVSIPAYQNQLNALSVSIMDAVNKLQKSGYDLDGDAGVAFFTGTSAKDIAVNATIVNDADKIAASSNTGSTTDGTIATSISNLESELTLNSGTSTFSDYYNSLVSKVGTDVNAADSKKTSQTTAVSTYKNLRDSVSSVSTDEEQTRLIQYQQSYEAAAKVMTVLEELLKTLINM